MLSENGDLVFAASRDLQLVGAASQVQQSIRTRLKIPRGSWDYDLRGTMGSLLYTIRNAHPEQAQTKAEIYVREALRDMEDIVVDEVHLLEDENDSSAYFVNVIYHEIGTSESAEPQPDSYTFLIPPGG
jgi:phage gp46-like protein